MGNTLVILGIVLVFAGIMFNLLSKGGIPLLPGDILVKKDSFTFYFPVATSILLSIIISVVLYFLRK